MDAELIQNIINVVFKGNMVFLSPFLFLLMVVLFTDRLIEIIYAAVGEKSSRRGNY